jgi:hypothetical protein
VFHGEVAKMAPTRSQKPNSTSERDSLLGDALYVDEQVQRDGREEDLLPEPVAIQIMSVMICFGSIGLYTASIGVRLVFYRLRAI